MSEPFHIILNPAASAGAGMRMRARLERELARRGLSYRLHVTRAPGHACDLAQAAARAGASRLLVVGGDGTIHEVANGLLRLGNADELPPTAILPVGTGNDFYRMVGPVRTVTHALDMLTEGRPRLFDAGHVRWDDGEAYFVNLLGTGVDVEVLLQRSRFNRLSGLPQYILALLLAVRRFRPVALRIRRDGDEEVLEGRSLLCAMTVGPSVAGGIRLNPDAVADDGLLDLCLVDALTFLQVVRYLPVVLRGAHRNLPVVRMRRFRSLTLERADGEAFHFEMDGELVPGVTRSLQVHLIPRCFPVLLAPEGDA